MSADPVLGYPCDECGAPAGEPCPDSCREWGAALSDTPLPLAERSQAAISKELAFMPFAGFLGDPPDRREFDLDRWLELTAAWLTDYRAVLEAHVAKLSADSTRAIALQMEKDIVRNFFAMRQEDGECR